MRTNFTIDTDGSGRDTSKRGVEIPILDATIQSQVLDALRAMQLRRGVAMLVITHDLAVVWRLAQRVLVLQQGRVHEQGDTAQVFAAPRSAYTRALLQASTAAARLTLNDTRPSSAAGANRRIQAA